MTMFIKICRTKGLICGRILGNDNVHQNLPNQGIDLWQNFGE